mmetsp:Transcript_61869/g.135318  ORF Transcript_61869/g.135318 Transcript_61869/m.135318 type:complete len:419 (+) Transcript_61869:160-1416(+)
MAANCLAVVLTLSSSYLTSSSSSSSASSVLVADLDSAAAQREALLGDLSLYAFDDCQDGVDCGMNLLQLRGKQATLQTFDSHGGPGLEDLALFQSDLEASPDEDDDDDDDTDEEKAKTAKTGEKDENIGSNEAEETSADAGTPSLKPGEAMCGSTVFTLAKQGCCGASTFDLTQEGCCGGETVYKYSQQGCCNENVLFNLKDGCPPPSSSSSSSSSGSSASSSAADTVLNHFTCGKEWPIPSAVRGWNYYCKASGPKAWAMNSGCTNAWYNVSAESQDEAIRGAAGICSQRAGEECTVLDLDGSICKTHHMEERYQNCAGQLYNRDQQGCCEGRIYNQGTHGCCGTTIYPKGSHSCCGSTPYKTSKYGCCGGSQIFRSSTQGCCLDGGLQLFWLGRQNCCRHPAGVCTISSGEYSCCH